MTSAAKITATETALPKGVSVIADGQGLVATFASGVPEAGSAFLSLLDHLAAGSTIKHQVAADRRYRGMTLEQVVASIDADIAAGRRVQS